MGAEWEDSTLPTPLPTPPLWLVSQDSVHVVLTLPSPFPPQEKTLSCLGCIFSFVRCAKSADPCGPGSLSLSVVVEWLRFRCLRLPSKTTSRVPHRALRSTRRALCVWVALSTYMRIVPFPAYPHRVPMCMPCESSRWRSAEATEIIAAAVVVVVNREEGERKRDFSHGTLESY